MWSFGILLWEIYSFGRVPYPRIVSIRETFLFPCGDNIFSTLAFGGCDEVCGEWQSNGDA